MIYSELIENFYIKNEIFKRINIIDLKSFENNIEKIFFLKDNFKKYNKISCYLELNSSIGGIDSQQINKFYFDFYYKWLKKNNFDVDIIFSEKTDFGYKKILLIINDKFSFLLFKNESGIHRFIRKNPLISSNKIQTSYLNVNVYPKIINKNFVINKEDILIENFKSKGAGGQHVNTTNSAVRLTHLPTNIIINCQSERSQIKNKNFALKLLEFKLLMKSSIEFNNYINNFKNNKKYIKTYHFENNIIIDHIFKKKYDLNSFFNLKINFI